MRMWCGTVSNAAKRSSRMSGRCLTPVHEFPNVVCSCDQCCFGAVIGPEAGLGQVQKVVEFHVIGELFVDGLL